MIIMIIFQISGVHYLSKFHTREREGTWNKVKDKKIIIKIKRNRDRAKKLKRDRATERQTNRMTER